MSTRDVLYVWDRVMQKSVSYSLAEIYEWMWQIELQTIKVDAKPIDDIAKESK